MKWRGGGGVSTVIKNCKTAIAEHSVKGRTLLKAGPCVTAHAFSTPTEPVLLVCPRAVNLEY